jgi:hypothetical protein
LVDATAFERAERWATMAEQSVAMRAVNLVDSKAA